MGAHHLGGDFRVLIGDDALGAGQKTHELIVGMGPFGGLKQAGDDIVPPWRGAAGEDNAQAAGGPLGGAGYLGNDFHQFILAYEGQLLPGHLEHIQIKAL